MKKTKIKVLNTYIDSILDFNAYNSFFKLSIGKAFLYLLFLTIFLGGFSIIRPLYNFNTKLDTVTRDYKKDAPEFTFKDGKLTVDSEVPLRYGDSDYRYIIDTTGKTKSSILNDESGMLITKDSIYQKDFFGKISKVPLSSFKGINFNRKDIEKILPKLKIIDILIIIFYPIKFFIGYIVNALILALLGLILRNILKMKLTFGDCFKLSFYALTLPTTFKLIIIAIDKPMSGFSLYSFPIFYGIGCIYLLKAFTVIKINEQ